MLTIAIPRNIGKGYFIYFSFLVLDDIIQDTNESHILILIRNWIEAYERKVDIGNL